MKTKPFLKSIMAVGAALFTNINPLSAMCGIEDEDIAIMGSGSGAFSAAIHLANKGSKVTMLARSTICLCSRSSGY